MTDSARWLPREPGKPLPSDSRVEKWRRWLEDTIRSEVLTVWWHRDVYRRVAQITQEREPHLPASHFFDQLSSTYATSQAAAIRRQTDRDPRVISLARLLVEIRGDPGRLSRERFVSQYDVDQQTRADSSFSEMFAGNAGDHVDRDLVAADLDNLLVRAKEVVEYVNRHVAHADARRMTNLPTFAELNGAIDAIGEAFKKYVLLVTVESYATLVPVPQYDWEAVFREPWILPAEQE
jgi:hypothetical protein